MRKASSYLQLWRLACTVHGAPFRPRSRLAAHYRCRSHRHLARDLSRHSSRAVAVRRGCMMVEYQALELR